MKPIVISLFAIICHLTVKAQINIKLEDVAKHIGDSVTVCCKVADMRYFENSKNKPTLLNMGAKHPNALLTVVIWENTRALFTTKIEDLKDKEVCVTGRIILYKEKPEIVIDKPGQIIVQ